MNRASYALHGETSWEERKRTGIFVARDTTRNHPMTKLFRYLSLWISFAYFFLLFLCRLSVEMLSGRDMWEHGQPSFHPCNYSRINLCCINAITNPLCGLLDIDYRFLVNSWNYKYLYDRKFLFSDESIKRNQKISN